jgi:hypothetical protein
MRKTSTNRVKGEKNRPKTKLGIPDFEQSKAAVLRSLSSPDSRRGYQHAIDEFVAWYCSEPRRAFNKTVVLRYRFHLEERGLAPGTINVRMAAVRRLAYDAADSGLLSPELAAGIHRVKGVRKLGSRLGNLQPGRRRRSGSCPIAKLLRESVIERFWPSCLVAGCGAANLLK